MKNFIILVLLVIVAGLGYMLVTKKCGVTPVRDEPVLSASFSCKDGASFIAEFSDESSVKIIQSNNIQIVSRVSGEGKRYENEGSIYTFAGEEVVVTTKSNGSTTTCEQPVDKNNAPLNFGDTGEGGGIKQDVGLAISENIVGKWKSGTDAKFVQEFRADGTVINTYEGKDTGLMQGTWKAYTQADTAYVQVTLTGNQDGGVENYKIGKLTSESLELIDVENARVTTFTSIK